jgi:hypothetical protein
MDPARLISSAAPVNRVCKPRVPLRWGLTVGHLQAPVVIAQLALVRARWCAAQKERLALAVPYWEWERALIEAGTASWADCRVGKDWLPIWRLLGAYRTRRFEEARRAGEVSKAGGVAVPFSEDRKDPASV